MRRVTSAFEGCYDASRAAALAGVPLSTVYDWARKGVVEPTVSRTKPMFWSYADLMALRVVYWLRHPKRGPGYELLWLTPADEEEPTIPASPMPMVRNALLQVEAIGVDLWSIDDTGAHTSPLLVDRAGHIVINTGTDARTTRGQGVMTDVLDLLGPFDTDTGPSGPDLRRPRPHLRIVPGKVSGEPHIAHSRLTTQTVVALADRGYNLKQIRRLYPDENPDGLREAIELEHSLAA